MTDVSVLTPSYQYARFLPDALDSVSKQRGVSVEHIVQDGGSTDGTLEVLSAAGARVSWKSEPDEGIGDALNRALQRATGRWIGWLNADEFLMPDALSSLSAAAEAEDAAVVYGDVAHVDAEGRLVRVVAKYPFNERVLYAYGPFIPTCAMLVRRDVLGDSPWNSAIRGIAEFPLYLKLAAARVRFVYVPHVFGAYRVHADQDSLQPTGAAVANRAALGPSYDHPYPPPTARGRVLHRLLKVRSGAYLRELAWLRRRGEDMRWFREES